MADLISTKPNLSAVTAFTGLKLAPATVTQLQTMVSEVSVAKKASTVALLVGATGSRAAATANAIAAGMRRRVLRIDLSAIVSKFIGETEKNLDQALASADPAAVVLFFDEADALFGKRSEVKDSHDRFADIEVNYLLQRLESFAGLALVEVSGEPNPAVSKWIRYTVRLVPSSPTLKK
jgi:SpoVK/Ycf46/Vps4 family AAA+-type ATPase